MILQPILHSFAYSLDFLREQVATVPDADLAAQPPGIANHPAWIIGHLTYTCQMLGGVVGLEEWLPADYAARFGSGSTPLSDRAAYPPKTELLARLADAQARLADATGRLNDAALDEPFPEPAYRDVFPTVRHAITQVLVGHTAFHIGQLAVWRKAMNLPAIGRSYE